MEKIDAVNAELIDKKPRPKKFWGLRIAAVAAAAGLIALTIYIQGVRGFHKKRLEAARSKYDEVYHKVSLVENAKKQRIDFFRNRFFIDFPVKYSYSSADFIRRLSLIAAAGIKLSNIELTPAGQNVGFSIDGSASSIDNMNQETAFLRFFQRIENFEDAILVGFKKNSNVIPGKALYFTITGEIIAE
ncbi:MAG: hypothetical protein L0Y73_02660 [Candidatus Aminicenantes bacterium]|nr:hypothetical protein [Candidatus Aminicenantes bacterium]